MHTRIDPITIELDDDFATVMLHRSNIDEDDDELFGDVFYEILDRGMDEGVVLFFKPEAQLPAGATHVYARQPGEAALLTMLYVNSEGLQGASVLYSPFTEAKAIQEMDVEAPKALTEYEGLSGAEADELRSLMAGWAGRV